MSEIGGGEQASAHRVPDRDWLPVAEPGLEAQHSWESQVGQYPPLGPPGVSYFAGELPGRGIGTALVLESRVRWPGIDPQAQRYTAAGAAFERALLARHPRKTPHPPT